MSNAKTPRFAFRWLGTAGFQLRFAETQILVDPFLSRSTGASPQLNLSVQDLTADAVFLTHGHFDHASDVPAIVEHIHAPVYASTRVCELLHDMGVLARQLHPLAGGRQCEIGRLKVLAFSSRHVGFDLPLVWRALRRVLRSGQNILALFREASNWPQGDVLGYQFVVSQGSVVHLGSAGWHQDELVRLRPDVALLPLQGRSNIARVALQMVELLRPKCVVPHHYDDFYPPLSEGIVVQPFFDLVRERLPEVETVEPRIGTWMPLCGAFQE